MDEKVNFEWEAVSKNLGKEETGNGETHKISIFSAEVGFNLAN